jgi:hypothetical protein
MLMWTPSGAGTSRLAALVAAALLLSGAAARQPRADVTVAAGQETTKDVFTITNSCRQEHLFTLTHDGLGLVSLQAPEGGVRVAPGRTVAVAARIDARNTEPGTNSGQVAVDCADCAAEVGCKQDRFTIEMNVAINRPVPVIQVTVMLYSGRRDPTFELSDPEVIGMLDRAVLQGLREPGLDGRSVVPSILGYAGIRVEVDEHTFLPYLLPLPMIVYRDHFEGYAGPGRSVYLDSSRQVERILLEAAQAQGAITPAELARIRHQNIAPE